MRYYKSRPLICKLLLEAFLNSDDCHVQGWTCQRQNWIKLGARQSVDYIIMTEMIQLVESGEIAEKQLYDARSSLLIKAAMVLLRRVAEDAKLLAHDKQLRIRIVSTHQMIGGKRGCGMVHDREAWSYVQHSIKRMLARTTVTKEPSLHL